MLVGTVLPCAIIAKLALYLCIWELISNIYYIRVNEYAFLSELAFGEVGAFLCGMNVGTLFVREVAVGPVSAFDLLFVFLIIDLLFCPIALVIALVCMLLLMLLLV
jgi:hypothetical protein